MKIKYLKIFLLLASLLPVMAACSKSQWSEPGNWFEPGQELNKGYADVFYLVSTNFFHEEDSLGNMSLVTFNTDEEKEVLAKEMAYIQKEIFPDSLNFFSPYYHQFTMDCLSQPEDVFDACVDRITDEVYDSFRYYLRHKNNGRPVILAGFSQGALLIKEMLKKMDDDEYSKIAAAYMLGWGLNDEDLLYENVKPAEGPDDIGVCISLNSVADTTDIWDLVWDDADYSINPVNWRTDSTPAEFEYLGDTLTVSLDTIKMVLNIDDFKEPEPPFPPVWPAGCLHSYEIRFYNENLNDNALVRVNKFKR